MIIGLGSTFWGHSIFTLSHSVSFIEAEYLPYHIKMIPFFFSHLGIFFAFNTTQFIPSLSENFVFPLVKSPTSSPSGNVHNELVTNSNNSTSIFTSSFQKNIVFYNFHTKDTVIKIYTFFNQKWHFDDLYNRFIVQNVVNFGYNTSYKIFDAGWIAYIGPYGIANIIQWTIQRFSKLQTGFVYHYAFIILIAISLTILFGTTAVALPSLSPGQDPSLFILALAFGFFSMTNQKS
jgi:NADH:ubiquinone oxidoreductase subunit 5 (subunit L)/multisubunit Na+/H+ antiporter MnhA subunit